MGDVMTADELARVFAGESLPEPTEVTRPSLDRWLGGMLVSGELLIAGGAAKQVDVAMDEQTKAQWVESGRVRPNVLREQLQGRTFRFPSNDDHEE